jgi:hypothetical protein
MSASRRLLLLLAAFIGLCLWAYASTDAKSPPWIRPDDERPPIIISDGSVDFKVGRNEGVWKQLTAGVNTAWFHDNSVKTLYQFVVTLVNSKVDANHPNCGDAQKEFTVTTFKVKFKGLASGGTVTANIQNNHFFLQFADGADATTYAPYVLISKGGPLFFHLRHLDSIDLGGSDLCSFKGHAEIHTRQITR